MKTHVRKHAELDEVDVTRVVWTAALRAGISNVTPHPELYAADRAVDLAREEVSMRLRDAARAWRRVSARLGRQLEPVVGSAVAVGTLIFARARQLVARTTRNFHSPGTNDHENERRKPRVASTRLTAKVTQQAALKSSEFEGA